MILDFAVRRKKFIARSLLVVLYLEMLMPARAASHPVVHTPRPVPPLAMPVSKAAPEKTAAAPSGGPDQPESQQFASVNGDNLVDLFTGDFAYSIPLVDVGGYPIAIGYSSGISMDQEASWTGLGWNINPGAITRNLRGLPDEFNGKDSIGKTAWVKENVTVGATGSTGMELGGKPINLGWSLGVFHNNYRGWGVESGFNASINATGKSAAGTIGLGLHNNSQEGFTISPSLDGKLSGSSNALKGFFNGSVAVGLGYNSRAGLSALSIGGKLMLFRQMAKVKAAGVGSGIPSAISFAYPTFNPTINIPFTSQMYSGEIKVGAEIKLIDYNFGIQGYITKQFIANEDTTQYLPAFGYLNFQDAARNPAALLDFNREREMTYRDKFEFPSIAIPSYTYDVFTMTGEGTGGAFRAYRSDVGYVYDHLMRSRDKSFSADLDLAFGDLLHVGVNMVVNRAYNETGAWRGNNPLANAIPFTQADKLYENVFFRNPGEKTINSREFYKALGDDDVVMPRLHRNGSNTPNIGTTSYLTRYKGGRNVGEVKVDKQNTLRKNREKRTQVITYLTAKEAAEAGFNKYIENYSINQFPVRNCENEYGDEMDLDGTGFKGEYFQGREPNLWKKYEMRDPQIKLTSIEKVVENRPPGVPSLHKQNLTVKWSGRIKAPVTGTYLISTISDDGVRVRINDREFIGKWWDRPSGPPDTASVNLEAGKVYKVEVDYYNGPKGGQIQFSMKCGSVTLGTKDCYWPDTTYVFNSIPGQLQLEERVNTFRKPHHLSQIDVLNSDGRRYVYGLPVYSLKEKESSFAVKSENGDLATGLVSYQHGIDNSTNNKNGNDNYYSAENVPAYPHSFLLTGIVSPDYTDLTGDGISDDDPGNGVKFNYTKTAGIDNPYQWRSPNDTKAAYHEGLNSDTRDDKGSFTSGEKELWYLHSIESKTMVATFKLGSRLDMASVGPNGVKNLQHGGAKKLEEINVYTKADFLKYNTNAKPVKTVHFEYNYELCKGVNQPGDTGKLTLKRIWFSYNGNEKGKKNAYVFHYNAKNPRYAQKMYDRWGNFKDPLQNPGSVTGNLIGNDQYPYALQDSALAAQNIAAWTLDSIQLPSGGRMKVTYESDDYAFVQNKRAARMMQVAGFSLGAPSAVGDLSNRLYDGQDNLYMAIHVPEAVHSKKDVYQKYLEGLDRIHFRLFVQMPPGKWGSGNEFVPGYAKIDGSEYGFINNNLIWVKVKSVDKKGLDDGKYSPMAKTAISFLRLNLPSKAYPGSEPGDDISVGEGAQMLVSMGANIINTFRSYDETARANRWARVVDLSRSFVRLHDPGYKKIGGGLRVKRLVIYDYWNAMTKQKESVYGKEYSYTTIRNIHGTDHEISSGVATYEPLIGAEENPFREPLEYREQMAALAPASMGYIETPLGETFFPAPSIGYSKVRSRSIRTKKTRSANGFDEVQFYTAYDFPVFTDHSLLDDETKMRYKPKLGNFLRINAKHHLVISQGFKVELNDMHGKPKSQAAYSENNPATPVSETRYYYHVESETAIHKKLKNTVLTMNERGVIDSSAIIGKDIELMADMREQKFVSNTSNINGNVDIFSFSLPPVLGYPSVYFLPQRQENLFRSAAMTKIINRHGLLDSVVVTDKGSKVTTSNLLFDEETGEVLLTATKNEFGDTLFQFSYPAGWIYEGMSGAYKNVSAVVNNANLKEGKMIANPAAMACFTAGDEVLAYTRNKTGGDDCNPQLATFRSFKRIWVVRGGAATPGDPNLFFMDEEGKPFTGNDVLLKVMRSGRKNIAGSAGSVTMMVNPLRNHGGSYSFAIDGQSKIIKAESVEYKDSWQIEDNKKQKIICAF